MGFMFGEPHDHEDRAIRLGGAGTSSGYNNATGEGLYVLNARTGALITRPQRHHR